jgi:hypothetical protein
MCYWASQRRLSGFCETVKEESKRLLEQAKARVEQLIEEAVRS